MRLFDKVRAISDRDRGYLGAGPGLAGATVALVRVRLAPRFELRYPHNIADASIAPPRWTYAACGSAAKG